MFLTKNMDLTDSDSTLVIFVMVTTRTKPENFDSLFNWKITRKLFEIVYF